MTHEQATQILNAVRGGANYPESVINAALRLTGDLDD